MSQAGRTALGGSAMDGFSLVLNAGSSSLKFCIFQHAADQALRVNTRGVVEGIGNEPRLLVRNAAGALLEKYEVNASDGRGAVKELAEWIRSKYRGAAVLGVGHRVVHGGQRFTGPALVTPQVLAELHQLTSLAPLHQPYNLAAIEAALERLPSVPQVACFDTSFHRGQPAVAQLVPLPLEIRRQGVQRYGFHGISYEYIASVLPQVAPEIAYGKVIVAHLGSGASLCALRELKSVDSSLGFTALDGLCMGTRPGALDPGVVLHLFQTCNLTAQEVETLLYKKCGLLGISGISNDMRDLLNRPESEARLAIDYFVYRAVKEIGALTAGLGGLDALIFTAGIGENCVEIRRRICDAFAWLGVQLDINSNAAGATRISMPTSAVSVLIIPTNEEQMIAQHMGELLGW